jgi:hypothetical protein
MSFLMVAAVVMRRSGGTVVMRGDMLVVDRALMRLRPGERQTEQQREHDARESHVSALPRSAWR